MEFYRSLDDANAYFDLQLFVADWTLATDANKVKALTQAARAIDSIRFVGYKVPVYTVVAANTSASQAAIEAADAEQSKQWPRDSDTMTADTPSTVMTIKKWATAPTAGTFTLSVVAISADGTSTTYTAAGIDFDASASDIEAALLAEGLTVVAAGGPINTADVTISMSGSSNERPTITPDATFLIDGILESVPTSVNVAGECPDRIFWAQCEEAITLLSGRDPRQEWENSVLMSDGVSSTRVSSDRGQLAPAHTRHFFTSATAWRYLVKYLDNKVSDSFKLERK